MDREEIGISGEDVADALFAGVDFHDISHDAILSSLLESPENIREIIADKQFPMTSDQVLALLFEFEAEGFVSEKYILKELSEGLYSQDQVLEILNVCFARMLNKE